MPEKFNLSPRLLSEPFWDVLLSVAGEHTGARARLAERLSGLDDLRAHADYNTGSISFAAGWCLYALVRHFRPRRALEVGTFIGKSTLSIAAAMDDVGQPGEVYTCDSSNDIALPWDGRTRIVQHPRATCTQMLAGLDGSFDFAFLDGRIQADDLPLIDRLLAPDALVALDDFEGVEKGVANLSMLQSLPRLKGHVLIYPPSPASLHRHGLNGYAITAVMIPISLFAMARQG